MEINDEVKKPSQALIVKDIIRFPTSLHIKDSYGVIRSSGEAPLEAT